jgi:hypothetical protein
VLDTTKATSSQAESGPSFHDYLLAEMRCASLRARILQHEIDAVGLALKGGAISAAQPPGACYLFRLRGGPDSLAFAGLQVPGLRNTRETVAARARHRAATTNKSRNIGDCALRQRVRLFLRRSSISSWCISRIIRCLAMSSGATSVLSLTHAGRDGPTNLKSNLALSSFRASSRCTVP